MSLRAFHIFFIAASATLAFFFGTRALPNLWISVSSFAAGGALVFYLLWFIRKMKRISR